SFLKRKTQSTDVSLQITSMADIFMILLVFLLKNYSASMTNLAPTSQLSLPEVSVSAKTSPKESLKIEVGPDAVLVDQTMAVKLNNFEFPASETENSQGSVTIANLMQKQRELRPTPNTESSIVVMADQRAPYSTIKRVIASVAGAGFVDLQLVVVDPQ
ncbi:MAG TPA: biopolymer transporter ExbD, partial [Bdellovibrio sp.]|nr:biopolymer transporter ExbD [Bdellovibrio sp.]